ncbi:putative zinc-binding alcohol dehydrogenase [Fusarium oxysporum f. sp. cubense]|uniref:Putative zinc-binding alcohol dehydrogenase n=1 Tax=Fusarium oxysporum f. sp. cubense TaxID=61366 RepID=A0A559KVE5_FUSOC|nr:putative zinc-binding alcohol dehydrogenase [Fusarium oxysporum f. sp. cubense]
MGHEFTGKVVSAGSAVKTVQVGDKVVSSFTVSCGECFYCRIGGSARCVQARLFGTKALDGAQAEYVRVPLADGTVVKAPDTISDQALVLMADIFPTGYFGVKSAVDMAQGIDFEDATVVVIGCGPVGLCAVIAAAHRRPRHLFAVDSIEDRLKQAQSLGAEPMNFLTDEQGMDRRVREVTDGRGADNVIEVVGLSSALRTAFDLVRPFGTISSIGVHNGEIPWTGNEAYGKNARLQIGRCPVRSVFPEALALLAEKQHQLKKKRAALC